MIWIILWLFIALLGVLAINASERKRQYKVLSEDKEVFELLKQDPNYKKFVKTKWIIKTNGYIAALILGPLVILACLFVYQNNFSIYYKVPDEV